MAVQPIERGSVFRNPDRFRCLKIVAGDDLNAMTAGRLYRLLTTARRLGLLPATQPTPRAAAAA